MNEMTRWPVGTAVPLLPPDELHVWCVRLARPPAAVSALFTILSSDEQARAAKFHFAEDRAHYVVGRATLRLLLGRYEGVEPTAVTFHYSLHGKPAMMGSDLRFNVSHAAGVALLAFARGHEVGVDVEAVRPLPDAHRVAKRFFAAAEYEAYTAVPDAQKPHAFFNCWTRKEAFIKAIGEGLSCPLKSFEVTLRPDEPAQLLYVRGRQTEAAGWQLHALEPLPGFVGAVLAERGAWQLHCWQWPDA
jgi:4'-phosphopantetheinyl transferase